jgi:hypothetical protein
MTKNQKMLLGVGAVAVVGYLVYQQMNKSKGFAGESRRPFAGERKVQAIGSKLGTLSGKLYMGDAAPCNSGDGAGGANDSCCKAKSCTGGKCQCCKGGEASGTKSMGCAGATTLSTSSRGSVGGYM